MKNRSIKADQNNWWRYYIKQINLTFLALLFLTLSIFWIYANITKIIFSPNKLDIVTQDLHDIALYFQYFDKDTRDFLLTLDDIIQSYINWVDIFTNKNDEIEFVLQYMKDNKEYLLKVWFQKYEKLANTIIELFDYRQEIYKLLWKDNAQNYLILLQNTSEKRPNWWFFWSFAFVSFDKWFIKDLEIIDSYYPKWINPDIRVPVPERATEILGTDSIWFISANKFGFTTTDWHNIKTLYDLTFNDPNAYIKKQDSIDKELFEKTFNKKIRWVIFLRSDFLISLTPDIKELLYERQYANAAIDIIRWENLPDKKEIYKKEIENFFNENKPRIAKNIINNFNNILSDHYINIYIENISSNLKKFIKENKLTTNYAPENIYIRDANNSYNKIDGFINKTVKIYKWDLVVSTNHADIIDISTLESGEYTLKISYKLSVPDDYMQLINSFNEKYNIKITSREKGILGVEPVKDYQTWEEKWRETKTTVHFPLNATILSINWDVKNSLDFKSPFSKWLHFISTIVNENNKTNDIRIKFKL